MANRNRILWVIVILVIGYLFYKYIFDGTVPVISQVDQKEYFVRNNKDKQKNANYLGMLNTKFETIVNSLRRDRNYMQNAAVQRLIRNWDNGLKLKEIGLLEGDAAYVINKQYMSFCLQDSSNGASLTDRNLITYVGIHELAHVMSIEIGHGPEFINNFQFLLDYSKGLNWYNPIIGQTEPLYVPLNSTILATPLQYCGVSIANSMN